MSWNRKKEEILCFWFCLEILSLTCDFCSNQTVFWGLEQNCCFIIFSKNINILVAKTCDFPQKRFCFVDKSTPSISRISLPKNGHHFCGHLELFFTRKITKKLTTLTIFSYFVMINFSNMFMSNLPLKILTSSKNHINFRQTFH